MKIKIIFLLRKMRSYSKHITKFFTKKSIIDLFTQNISLKLLSIFIATMLWFVIISSETITKSVLVPTTFISVPKDHIAVVNERNLSMIVKGSKSLIDNLQYGTISLIIDVSALPIGESKRRVILADIVLPIGIEALELDPTSVNIILDKVDSKKVRVTPVFIGKAPYGFQVTSIVTEPNIITISGIKSKINLINSIETHQINLSDLDINSEKYTSFLLPEGVTVADPDSVKIIAKLSPIIGSKVLTDITIECKNLSSNLSLKDDVIIDDLTIEGRLDLLDRFQTESRFFINCSDIVSPGYYFNAVTVESDIEDIEIKDIDRLKIKFEIEDA